MNPTQALPSCYSKKTLDKNRRAIAAQNAGLDRRLSFPVDGSHVSFDTKGEMIYGYQNRGRKVALGPDIAAKVQEALRAGESLLCGIGDGGLAHCLVHKRRDVVLTLWDRDPWLLRLFLMRYDISREVKAGRLRVLLGIDLVLERDRLSQMQTSFHPMFRDVYANEFDLLQNGVTRRKALLCSGALFVDDIALELRSKGFSVYTLDHSVLGVEEIDNVFEVYDPDVVFCINYVNGMAEYCERKETPLVCWEIDPSTETLVKCQTTADYSHIYTYRKKNVPAFRESGFEHSRYMPLAASIEKRFPPDLSAEEEAKYRSDVSFVGASMVSQAALLQRQFLELYAEFKKSPDAVDQGKAILQSVLDAQRKDLSQYRIEELLGEADPEFAASVKPGGIDPCMLLGETAAAERRLRYVAALGEFGIQVWGDTGWQRVEKQGAQYKGEAGHRHEINKIYSCALINVDINRLYQLDMVTMRVFDVMACGGFVLAEYSDQLAELFKIGEEVDAYRTLPELQQKIKHYLTNRDQVKRIAENGRKRVLADHSMATRLSQMLEESVPAKRPKGGVSAEPKVKSISIMGERNSGTNYLEWLVLNNTSRVNVGAWRLGWKHAVPSQDEIRQNGPDHAVVVVLKSIPSQLVSLYRRPHEMPYRCKHEGCRACDLCEHDDKLSFEQFVKHEYYSIRAAGSGYLQGVEVDEELLFERSPETGERFPNLVTMLSSKYARWLSLAKDNDNVSLVPYEELLKNPKAELGGVCSQYGIPQKSVFRNLESNTKEPGKGFDASYYLQKQYMKSFPDSLLAFVKSNLADSVRSFL